MPLTAAKRFHLCAGLGSSGAGRCPACGSPSAAWSRLETGFASAGRAVGCTTGGRRLRLSVDGSVPRMYQRERLGPLQK